ncbi:hypothetical protein E4U61_007267 [Claviceps capensis]|nr:hypothetical protein E4U61_007267 [Claviceps capensis]
MRRALRQECLPPPAPVTTDDDEVHPFVIQDFLKVLKTAFLPKDIASRALQKGYAIRQGPAQPLAHEQGKWLDGTLRLAGRGNPGKQGGANIAQIEGAESADEHEGRGVG